MNKKKLINFTWVLIGWISLALGVIGIFLPLLPTTPFLILTAFCFSKGSQKLHDWILNHRHMGPIIQNWNENRIIPKKVKLFASATILSSIAIMWLKVPILWIKLVASLFSLSMLIFVLVQNSENKSVSPHSTRFDF